MSETKDNTRFKVRRKKDNGRWVAWPLEGGYGFTVNDGRVPGSTATLTTKDFWQIFEIEKETQ